MKFVSVGAQLERWFARLLFFGVGDCFLREAYRVLAFRKRSFLNEFGILYVPKAFPKLFSTYSLRLEIRTTSGDREILP